MPRPGAAPACVSVASATWREEQGNVRPPFRQPTLSHQPRTRTAGRLLDGGFGALSRDGLPARSGRPGERLPRASRQSSVARSALRLGHAPFHATGMERRSRSQVVVWTKASQERTTRRGAAPHDEASALAPAETWGGAAPPAFYRHKQNYAQLHAASTGAPRPPATTRFAPPPRAPGLHFPSRPPQPVAPKDRAVAGSTPRSARAPSGSLRFANP